MEGKNILIVADIVSVGRVGAMASAKILNQEGYQTAILPTALVSNNFGYEKYAMEDTEKYLTETIDVWRKLDFSFNVIMTGFIPSESQATKIAAFCKQQREKGTKIVIDPVMGDGGTLYSGLPESIVSIMRNMVGMADVTCPNYTEACYLTDTNCGKSNITLPMAYEMIDKIRSFGARSVVITSVSIDQQPSVAGYDDNTKEYFCIHYDEIPVVFSGTGDIFAAVMVTSLDKGETLKEAVQTAVDTLSDLIMKNKDYPDKYMGLPI